MNTYFVSDLCQEKHIDYDPQTHTSGRNGYNAARRQYDAQRNVSNRQRVSYASRSHRMHGNNVSGKRRERSFQLHRILLFLHVASGIPVWYFLRQYSVQGWDNRCQGFWNVQILQERYRAAGWFSLEYCGRQHVRRIWFHTRLHRWGMLYQFPEQYMYPCREKPDHSLLFRRIQIRDRKHRIERSVR